jgi:hypothetical protein
MKFFKTIDEKLNDIGFVKIEEDKYGVRYERKNSKYNFTQSVDILHKASGRHILQSYDSELIDQKKIGNTCVGLTGYEMKLFLKKMKKIGLNTGRKEVSYYE